MKVLNNLIELIKFLLLDESSIAKLKSQYEFTENLDNIPRFNEPFEPIAPIVNTKPAVLIEKAQTREVLIPGYAKESNDFSCLVWLFAICALLYRVFRNGMHLVMFLIELSTANVQSRFVVDGIFY